MIGVRRFLKPPVVRVTPIVGRPTSPQSAPPPSAFGDTARSATFTSYQACHGHRPGETLSSAALSRRESHREEAHSSSLLPQGNQESCFHLAPVTPSSEAPSSPRRDWRKTFLRHSPPRAARSSGCWTEYTPERLNCDPPRTRGSVSQGMCHPASLGGLVHPISEMNHSRTKPQRASSDIPQAQPEHQRQRRPSFRLTKRRSI